MDRRPMVCGVRTSASAVMARAITQADFILGGDCDDAEGEIARCNSKTYACDEVFSAPG